jgi:glutaredoxin-related protein
MASQVPFKSVDILEDEALRAGVKVYGDWPTYPQLYVKGELLGGCDIVTEMKVKRVTAVWISSSLAASSHAWDDE